jgi:DNA-directed RNA polymerase subunit RPC12/RpoP
MDNLICTECGTTYYSAAAETMVDRGERCDCGSLLRLVHAEEVPVASGSFQCRGNGTAVSLPARRFTRG